MLNDLYQNILHLNTLTYTLRELLQNGIDFDWTEACNEACEKLKLCMSCDKCYSYLDKSV